MFLKIFHPILQVRILFLVLGIILLAGISVGCSLSFAADVTPPPAMQMAEVNLTSSSTPVVNKFPILLPNIQNGVSIYQAKCVSCHGVNGLGGGTQSSDLPNSVSAIGNLEFASQKEPVAWFEIVSEGNLDRSMPGYKSMLSDRQRWDVVAYLYTLAYKPDSLVAAGQIYQTECKVCHGNGGGNGNLAVQLGLEMPNWLDPSRLVEFSANDLKGIIEAGSENGMPAFGEQFNQEQIQSLAG
jgi:mono/diheme cytochrome c family protein